MGRRERSKRREGKGMRREGENLLIYMEERWSEYDEEKGCKE